MKKLNSIIENATETDLLFIINGIKKICKIEKEIPEKDSILIKNTKEAIRNKKIRIAKTNNKTLGFVQFTFSSKEPYGLSYGKRKEFCWLEWMYILEPYQRRGVGHLLHNDIKRICRKNKIKEIILDVFEINEIAKNFYKKEKFNYFIHILREKI